MLWFVLLGGTPVARGRVCFLVHKCGLLLVDRVTGDFCSRSERDSESTYGLAEHGSNAPLRTSMLKSPSRAVVLLPCFPVAVEPRFEARLTFTLSRCPQHWILILDHNIIDHLTCTQRIVVRPQWPGCCAITKCCFCHVHVHCTFASGRSSRTRSGHQSKRACQICNSVIGLNDSRWRVQWFRISGRHFGDHGHLCDCSLPGDGFHAPHQGRD